MQRISKGVRFCVFALGLSPLFVHALCLPEGCGTWASASIAPPIVLANTDDARTPTSPLTFGSKLKGPYFGQPLPGETPIPFAPELLNSVSGWVEATEFSPDGTIFFFSVGNADYSGSKLLYSKLLNGLWTPCADAPFTSDFAYSNEPVFSADGNILTFTGKKDNGSIDLWTVRRTATGWESPVPLPAPISSDKKDHRGSTMTNGTLYFCSNRSGVMQVYKASADRKNSPVVVLEDSVINTKSFEGDPCIAPDGHYLVFYSARDGRSADLYVSFRDSLGGWGTPINMGAAFNGPYDEYGAHLTTDGKYLFFTRHAPDGNTIYWVRATAIDKLRQ